MILEQEQVKTEVEEAPVANTSAKTEHKKDGRPHGKKDGRPQRNNRRDQKSPADLEFEEKVVDIARVTVVVKGGRRFSFSAIVVVGNKKGKIGWGHGKANEVPDAIKKAVKDARRNLIEVPIVDGRTIPHEIQTKFVASDILLKPAPKGKGIVASGSVRSVVELAGYKDIYTKSLGSRSKQNSVKATFEALKKLKTIEKVAEMRGVKPSDILG